jgi:hypothetical protein
MVLSGMTEGNDGKGDLLRSGFVRSRNSSFFCGTGVEREHRKAVEPS